MGHRCRLAAVLVALAGLVTACQPFIAPCAVVRLPPAPGTPAKPLPEAPNCPMLPADSHWQRRVDGLPLDPKLSAYVTSAGPTGHAHADFGSGLWAGGPIGMPYVVVPGSQARVPISFTYAGESDPGPYPIPPNAPIEGGPASTGDRHVLVVDKDTCKAWEVYAAYPQNGATSWTAASGALWDLRSNALRPSGWTSADAAGLPILPGLVRYDEVASGEIRHAIRMTLNNTDHRFVWPATHRAGANDPNRAPMGQRFRLKAGLDVSSFPPQAQVVLRALQTYGAIVADNGASWYVSGVPDPRWNDDDLHSLHNVKGSDFEAVDASGLMIDPGSGAAR